MARCRCLRHEDYTVAWIAALPVELAAATEMLDEEHFSLPPHASDTNIYTLGSIGEHNVVMACLPAGQTGTNAAATVATQIRARFASIRFYLLVGIGGGVPSRQADVRLGDVVVSQPGLGRGGVLQYDFGKSTPTGFERTGFLNAPPEILLSALAKIQATHLSQARSLSSHPFDTNSTVSLLSGPPSADLLFDATYIHVGGLDCESCNSERVFKRPLRKGCHIHYGTIASGNQVIRDGVTRDQLSADLGSVLCFEMEAAGIIRSMPCLVVRGICDYADSHKNKLWQPYAATTAAAYSRKLLLVVPSVHGLGPSDSEIKASGLRRYSQRTAYPKHAESVLVEEGKFYVAS